jgi:hypothetical protein
MNFAEVKHLKGKTESITASLLLYPYDTASYPKNNVT